MMNNPNEIIPSKKIECVSKYLDEMNLQYDLISEGVICIGFNLNDFFVDINIIYDNKLNRIVFLAKPKGLSFSKDVLPAVQDVITEINNSITYGHISLGLTGPYCVALYKCFMSPFVISSQEIKYNLDACKYMVKEYFGNFAHFSNL